MIILGVTLLFFHGLPPLPVVVASTNEDYILARSAPIDFHGNIFPLVATLTVLLHRVIQRLMQRDWDGAVDDLMFERRLLFFFF